VASIVTLYVDENNAAAVSSVFVNGDNFFFEAGEGCELQHGDRILIGQNYVFVYIDPTTSPEGEEQHQTSPEYVQHLLDANKVSFEMAKAELAEKQGEIGPGFAQQNFGSGPKLDQEVLERKEADKKRMQQEFEAKLQEAEQLKKKAQEDMERCTNM
jgi:hypothetical protein